MEKKEQAMADKRQSAGPSYEGVNRIRIGAFIAVVGASIGAALGHLLLGAMYGAVAIYGGAAAGALLFLGLAYLLRR